MLGIQLLAQQHLRIATAPTNGDALNATRNDCTRRPPNRPVSVTNPAPPPIPTPARDYKLAELIPWLTRGEPVLTIKTAELQPVYAAATRNIQQADSIIQMIAAGFYGIAVALGQVPKTGVTTTDFYNEAFSRWQLAATTQVAPIAMSAQATFAAYLGQGWTVFETFASDLWEAAANIRPKILADINKVTFSETRDPDGGKQIPLWLLERHGYDLRGKMGTLLRERLKFDSLLGIREAYNAAFSIDGTKVTTALGHDSFDALSCVRQVLVHRAGKADAEYVRKSTPLALAPKTQLDNIIELDGQVVANIFLAVFPKVIELFTAVDDWLVEHP